MAHDSDAALAMLPLLERGRVALHDYVVALPESDQPTSAREAIAAMNVVRLDDFITHAGLVILNVVRNGMLTHVLCESGHLCAIIEPRIVRKW